MLITTQPAKQPSREPVRPIRNGRSEMSVLIRVLRGICSTIARQIARLVRSNGHVLRVAQLLREQEQYEQELDQEERRDGK